MKKIALVLCVLTALSGCGAKPAAKKAENDNEVTISKTEYENLKKPKDDCATKNPAMSNTQIIAETKTCESNGLDAESLVCEGAADIVKIQCKPRTHDSSQ